jgi:hypothetical protein
MLEGSILAFEPRHADEVELLVDATYCKWHQKRIWNVETTLIEMTIAEKQHDLQRKLPKANVAAHVANAVQTNSDSDHLNRRYEAQLHRQYVRNIKLLRELQAERIHREPTLDQLYEDPAPTHGEGQGADTHPDDSPVPTHPETTSADSDPNHIPKPEEPKLTPEQAEIRRFEAYRDRLIAQAREKEKQTPQSKEPRA